MAVRLHWLEVTSPLVWKEVWDAHPEMGAGGHLRVSAPPKRSFGDLTMLLTTVNTKGAREHGAAAPGCLTVLAVAGAPGLVASLPLVLGRDVAPAQGNELVSLSRND